MNIKLILLALATVSIGSCSTAYKSGQTPDDVYYSPVRAIEERDNVRQTRDERRDDYYRVDNYEEREIRMSTRDRRWRDLNDYYDYNYSYNPYMYGYNHGYYYNPYYYNRPVFLPGYVIVNPKNSTPRMTNLGSYNNPTLQVANNNTKGSTKWVPAGRTYNNSNNSGSFNRRIITPATSYPNQGYNNRNSGVVERNDTRTYNPSSNNNTNSRSSTPSSSSSSSGSSSSGSVTRPTRGN